MSLAEKLHPSRYTEMSGKMAAIVACILREKWTEPAMAELCITSDGGLLARMEGDIGFNDFLGSVYDLERNVSNLLEVAELTKEERAEWDGLYAGITDWRRVSIT